VDGNSGGGCVRTRAADRSTGCRGNVHADGTNITGTTETHVPHLPVLIWAPCDDGFECSTATVPLDHDRPDGPTISLALIRLPASSPYDRIGSLFMNPGGPGGSGIDLVRGAKQFLPSDLRARFDIVGFDPRGIARSTPLRCYDSLDQATADLAPFPYPVSAAEERQQFVADRKLARACAGHRGPILKHMSTADVARDMDLLRQAVGDSRLNYLGYSYGSMLGQTYANLFPDKVRALVVDGVLDPIAWTTGRGHEAWTTPFSARIGSDTGAQQTLREFFRLCDEAGPNCAFAGNSSQRYAALLDRLREHPVDFINPETNEPVSVDDQVLMSVSLGALYEPAVWATGAQWLAALEQAASAEQLGQLWAAIGDAIGAGTPAQEQYRNFVEGSVGVACSDSLNPRWPSAWPRTADAAERRHGYFGRIWTWTWSPCAVWPRSAGQDRYLGPWSARTANPVLIVGNYFDPATRYQGAVTASHLLPNSRLLSYAGWGHVVSYTRGNDCIDSAVTSYLVSTVLPAAGTVCQPEGSPFDSQVAARSADASAASRAVIGSTLPDAVRRAFS